MISSLFASWRKPNGTQSEAGGGDVKQSRSHQRTPSWSVKGKGPFGYSSVTSSFYNSEVQVIARSRYPQAYSTAGSVRSSYRSNDVPTSRSNHSNAVSLANNNAYESVQEKLLASMFKNKTRSVQRKASRNSQHNSPRQIKSMSRAATEVDAFDLHDRESSTGYFKEYPVKQRHVYAQSEYKPTQSKHTPSNWDTIEEEDEDDLLVWGIPVPVDFVDEGDEEEEGEYFNSDFSGDDSFSQPAQSVTYQQLLEHFTNNPVDSSAQTDINNSAFSQKQTTKSELSTLIALAYSLYLVCPWPREKSYSIHKAFTTHPEYKKILVRKMLVLAYTLNRRPKKIICKRTKSPISSASTLVDKQIRQKSIYSPREIISSQSPSSPRSTRSRRMQSSEFYSSLASLRDSPRDRRKADTSSNWGF